MTSCDSESSSRQRGPVDELGLTWPTVQAALERLEKMEIVREVSGKKRNRLYEYTSQLHILNQGADSPG